MRARTLGALVALMALLAGCVSLPEAGSVSSDPDQEAAGQDAGWFDYTPSGPQPGASPLKIVEDFLLAMQASPQSTAVARKFLAEEARTGWFPEKTTLVYGSKLVSGSGKRFRLDLEETVQLDDRGTWLGPVGEGRGVSYELELVREQGEWRITNPPDALLIPRSHFDTRYQQYFVYFFDPSGRVLVPEPTYLPRGEQAATLLVRRLQRGPSPRLDGVLRTHMPGSDYVLSVPVSPEGVADVELDEQLLRLDQDDRQMALAQLAWTLRQVPGLGSMRVTVGNSPIDIPGAGSPQNVSSWSEFDPAIHWASQELVGIDEDGQVVALTPAGGEVVGRFGAGEYALREVGADLAAEQVAGVTEDGSTVVLAPRGKVAGEAPEEGSAEVVHEGTDVLKPAWDVFGGVWLVDRTSAGARVGVVRGGTTTWVEAPGIDGEDVSAFVVSRDGSRLVAVVRERSGDHLVIARVKRGEGGRVRGLTRAVDLPLAEGGVDEIRDLSWRTPGSLAVLTGPTPETSQVLLALVDGSTALADVDTTAEILRRRAVHLVSSPSAGTAVYLGGEKGELYELGADGQWVEARIPTPLRAPTFVG